MSEVIKTGRPTIENEEGLLGIYYPVLDKGFVSLVDYMGTDSTVPTCARTSYGLGTKATSNDKGLVRYLRGHRHTSPFEFVEFHFHCSMPIFVARQWVRHRTACLSGDTKLHFDLPGGIERRGNQLHTLTVEEVFRKFQPTTNTSRPDKQRDPLYRRSRVNRMHLRCIDEVTGVVKSTNIVDIWESGVKPVFLVKLKNGMKAKMSKDHLCFTSMGWKKLQELVEIGSLTSVNEVIAPPPLSPYIASVGPGNHLENLVWGTPQDNSDDRVRDGSTTALGLTFEPIESVTLVGDEMTYDLEVSGPHHNFSAGGLIVHNSINEVSGRYSILPMLFHTPEADHFSKQSQSNKQGREGEIATLLHTEAAARWEKQRNMAQENYEWLIGEDVARELARIDLPLSTYTQWHWKIDGHNLMHFLGLRCETHAQWEIRVFANTIAGILERGWPNLFEAWADYNFKSRTFSRQEMQVLCQLLKNDGTGLSPTRTEVTIEGMVKAGLSKREIGEFLVAFDASKYEKPTFELPEPKPFEYFMLEAQAAEPKVDGDRW
jgi:thymidylate synthase ThyX